MSTFERKSELTEEADNGILDSFSTSRVGPWPSIAHYWGTVVRQLLLGAAALMLLTSPLYGDSLRIEFPFEVVGAILIVACAAMTNPHGRYSLMADAIASGTGAAIYGIWAIFEYDSINPIAFVLRVIVAIVFLFAFYFSLKTVRAFALNQVGRHASVDEFETEEERRIEATEEDVLRPKDMVEIVEGEKDEPPRSDIPPGGQASGYVK